jgi:hypothetical protein
MNNTTITRPPDANRDRVTDAPGAHPVGTGLSALLGGAADFVPAYTYGVSSYGRSSGRKFDEVQADLSRDWTAPAASPACHEIAPRTRREMPGIESPLGRRGADSAPQRPTPVSTSSAHTGVGA